MKKTSVKIGLLVLMFVTSSLCVVAQDNKKISPEMVDRANQMNESLSGHYHDPNSVSKNLSHPLMSDEKMSTASGDMFDANIGCKSSNTFMKILATSGSSGDATFNIEIDGNMDGRLDTLVRKTGVSGVCANGYLQCNAGTWQGCREYQWQVKSGMKLQGVALPSSSWGKVLKSCYCINKSCGNGLLVKNFDTILKDVGSGIANAFQKVNPYYTVSDVQPDGPLMRFFGQEPASCKDQFNGALTGYKQTPGKLASDAFGKSKASKVYNTVSNSAAAGNTGLITQKCKVTRDIALNDVKITDIIEFVGGDGSVSYCGSNCIELTIGKLGDDYWQGRCDAFNTVSKFNVKRPEMIEKAVLVQAVFDDWIYVSNSGKKVYAGPFNWNGTRLPPGRSCELKTHWIKYPNVDFTDSFKQPGVVELKTKVLVYGGGEGYTKARIYVNLKDEHPFSVKIGAPGDNVLRYEFDLMSGTSQLIRSDSVRRSTIELPEGFDFGGMCDNKFEFTSDGSALWEPPAPYRSTALDNTVNLKTIQSPTCSNGLKGIVEVIDTNGDQGTLGGEFRFKAYKDKCAITKEDIIDSCQAYDNKRECRIKYESVDGVETYRNFISTSLLPVPQSKVITGEVCSELVRRDWFEKKREYECETESHDFDFSEGLQRQHTIVSSATTGGYKDQIFKDGRSQITNHSLGIPEVPEPPECVQACKTRKRVEEIGVNQLGNTAKNRKDSTKYEYFYHECQASACPLGAGEQVVKSCQCLNEFTEAASIMQVLRLAGKDMICTSGNQKPLGN
ncbi:hypothetical protein [Pseudoalteromonas luteoviolacea]|uniref:hypothetical protein n=1 Tax=Pseudoalteromonas luteoviolacea TaxID=43657 RepID=UPI001B3700BD|nr:hypothetical protein [Pseudoalteromonas luteoviolacea]MBQ4839842.1 hypothetical protein [Pseudoalteromonas luteoviolacea]